MRFAKKCLSRSHGGSVLKRIHDLASHPEHYVTTTDLAEYWHVSRKQIYKQIQAGTLKAMKLGPRLFRVSIAEALRFEIAAKMYTAPDLRSVSASAGERTVFR